MLLNSGAGEDSWESLGVQGDQASQYLSKSTLNIHWEDWCWGWNSNTLATWCEELTHWKRPWCWGDWRQEKAAAEDEMVRYHHLLNGHEFEQTPGDTGGQRSLARCSPWGHRVRLRDWTARRQALTPVKPRSLGRASRGQAYPYPSPVADRYSRSRRWIQSMHRLGFPDLRG